MFVESAGNPDWVKVIPLVADGRETPVSVAWAEPGVKVAVRVYEALVAPRSTVMSAGVKVDDNE